MSTKTLPVLYLLLILYTSHVISISNTIGIWESEDYPFSSSCDKMSLEIDSHFFILYFYGGISCLPSIEFGTYMISDHDIVVRGLYTDFVSYFGYTEMNVDHLEVVDRVRGNVSFNLYRREKVLFLDGAWEFAYNNQILAQYSGFAMFDSGVFYMTTDSKDLMVNIVDDISMTGSAGTCSLYMLYSSNSLSLPSILSENMNVFGTGYKFSGGDMGLNSVTIKDKRADSEESGSFYKADGYCYHHLKLYNGVYREIITGNIFCTNKSYKIGYYVKTENDLTITYLSSTGSQAQVTTTFNASADYSSLQIGEDVYLSVNQTVKTFRRITIPLLDSLATLTESLSILVELWEIDLDDIDVISFLSANKRSNGELDVLVHQDPENADNIEQIEVTGQELETRSTSSDSIKEGESGSISNSEQGGTKSSHSGDTSSSSMSSHNGDPSFSSKSNHNGDISTSTSKNVDTKSPEKTIIVDESTTISPQPVDNTPDSEENPEILFIIIAVVAIGSLVVAGAIGFLLNCVRTERY